MLMAVVKDNIVENVIVINEKQIKEIEEALECELVDAKPYGLTIGDLRTPRGWTRNAGGEQIVLPELEEKHYDSYTIAMERAANVDKAVELATEMATGHAVAIIQGDLDDKTQPELMAAREALDDYIALIADDPAKINANVTIIRQWEPSEYDVGEVCIHNEIPYKCTQCHNSTEETNLTPESSPELWSQYHGTTEDTAREYIEEDKYETGEFAVYEDKTYECLSATVSSPITAKMAWKIQE